MQTYTNQYTVTKKMVQDYVLKALFREKFKMGICIGILASLLMYVSMQKQDTFSMGMYGTCIFIILFVLILGPIMTVKQLWNYHNQMHSKNSVMTTVTFQEQIQMDEGSIHLEFPYAQIRKCYFTKDLWVLMIQKNSGIMLDPKGFDGMEKEEFMCFLKEKCKSNN